MFIEHLGVEPGRAVLLLHANRIRSPKPTPVHCCIHRDVCVVTNVVQVIHIFVWSVVVY